MNIDVTMTIEERDLILSKFNTDIPLELYEKLTPYIPDSKFIYRDFYVLQIRKDEHKFKWKYTTTLVERVEDLSLTEYRCVLKGYYYNVLKSDVFKTRWEDQLVGYNLLLSELEDIINLDKVAIDWFEVYNTYIHIYN